MLLLFRHSTKIIVGYSSIYVNLKVKSETLLFQAFNLLFITWISDGQAQDWDEYWDEK